MKTLSEKIQAALIAGLAGGALSSIVLAFNDQITKLSLLLGSSNIYLGIVLHLVLMALLAILFTLFSGRLLKDLKSGLLFGLVLGLLWWLVGDLLLIPFFKSGAISFNLLANPMSLLADLIFGLVYGVVFVGMTAEENNTPPASETVPLSQAKETENTESFAEGISSDSSAQTEETPLVEEMSEPVPETVSESTRTLEDVNAESQEVDNNNNNW